LGRGNLPLKFVLLLLKPRGFLLLRLKLLLKRLQLLLALAYRALGLCQFTQQLIAVFPLLVQGQPHDRGQIFPAIDLIGRDFRLNGPLGALVGYLVDINGGKGQQAHQQEIADDNQDAPVHNGAASGCVGTGTPVS
jgi:hypothetical protein